MVSHKENSLWNTFSQDVEYYLVYRIITLQSLELALTGLLVESIIDKKRLRILFKSIFVDFNSTTRLQRKSL